MTIEYDGTISFANWPRVNPATVPPQADKAPTRTATVPHFCIVTDFVGVRQLFGSQRKRPLDMTSSDVLAFGKERA